MYFLGDASLTSKPAVVRVMTPAGALIRLLGRCTGLEQPHIGQAPAAQVKVQRRVAPGFATILHLQPQTLGQGAYNLAQYFLHTMELHVHDYCLDSTKVSGSSVRSALEHKPLKP